MSGKILRIADFGPYTQSGQAPGDPPGKTPPPLSQMEAEVDFIAANNFANTLRLYSTDDNQGSLINYAIQQDKLDVVPSVYLTNPNSPSTDRTPPAWADILNNGTVMGELNSLCQTLESLPTIDFASIPFVVIGNEAISIVGGWNEADIESAIGYVKTKLQQDGLPGAIVNQLKFTTAENYIGQYIYMPNNGTLDRTYNPADVVNYTTTTMGANSTIDVIYANINAYWDGVSISNAATYVADIYQELQKLYPGKEVVISETGWPSAGATETSTVFTSPQQTSVPSLDNEQTYWQDFLPIANQDTISFGAFEAYNEPNKVQSDPTNVENNWGLISANSGTVYMSSTFETAVTSLLSCFLRGTDIATPDGERAVETLRPDDFVLTASGEACPIVWIGSRSIDTRGHRHPAKVWPVRVRAGAFAENCPHRDLYLSPDHAVFLEGVLVPVGCLIDGVGIQQQPMATVAYYHIELPQHDLLLANGLLTESYLDVADRSNFENSGTTIQLFPDFSMSRAMNVAQLWETKGYAPLVTGGPILAALRARMLQHQVTPDVSATWA
jgi:exo-beta-1,3-glucanase (GH17 family)